MMDETTTRILDLLQADSRLSNAEVGRRVGLTPSAVLERIRKLRERDVIREFTARLDRRRIGFGITAFIRLRTSASMRSADIADQLRRLPEILEIHDVAGDDCFLLKVVARDMDHLHALIHGGIAAIDEVVSTSTTIVMRTFKETTAVPFEAASTAR